MKLLCSGPQISYWSVVDWSVVGTTGRWSVGRWPVVGWSVGRWQVVGWSVVLRKPLFRSSYFFRAATYFEELLFQNSRFFATVIFFQNSYFFRAKILPSSKFMRIGNSLGQLLVSIINHKNIFDKYIYNYDNYYNEIFFKFSLTNFFCVCVKISESPYLY